MAQQADPGSPERQAIPALARGLKALRLLGPAGEAGLSFGELRRGLADLPAPTLSRLLKALLAAGYAARTPSGVYARGPELEALGREVSSGGTLEDAARAVLADFTRRTGESAAFARFYGDRLVLVDKVEVADSVKLAPHGQVFHPAPWEGPAIVVAAHLAGADFDRFARSDQGRLGSAAEFRKLAVACRAKDWRVEPLPHRPGPNAPRRICTPVLDPAGRTVGELHTVSPHAHEPAEQERLAAELLAARRQLEARLAVLEKKGA
jgi:DNA-binding IclR family transcriptional regulator